MKNLLCALCLLAIGTLIYSCSNNEDDNPGITCNSEAFCFIDGELLCLTGSAVVDTVPPIELGGVIIFPGTITLTLPLTEVNDDPSNIGIQKTISITMVDQNFDGQYDAHTLSYNYFNLTTFETCAASYITDELFIDIDISTENRIAGIFQIDSDQLITTPLNCIDQITEGQFDVDID